MALMALDFGLNLFIEKPAAHTVGDVERIRDRAADKNLAVMVGMHNRFREDLRTIRGFLDEEELGKLYLIKTGWLQAKHQAIKQSWVFQKNVSGGGVILDLGVQVIDTLLWMLHETTPKNVKAISFNMNEALKVEDFCAACITFENNLSLLIEVSWDFPILKDRVYLEIVGEKGTGTLSPLRLQKLWHGQLVNIAPEIHGNRMLHFKQGYENEVNHLIDFLLGREKKLESSIEDAIQVHKIIDKIYESAREGHEVSVE
jgi:predicted dehydrogenase